MFPSFVLFGKTIGMYSIMALIGYFCAGIYLVVKTKQRNVDENDIIDLLLWCGLSGVIGAHFLYGLIDYKNFIWFITNLSRLTSYQDILDSGSNVFGGAVFYGGLIGILISSLIVIKKKNLNWKIVSSCGACAIPLFHFFGRIGCFLVGCCYGIECQHGFTFTHSIIEIANGTPRLPVQLMEAGFNLLLFIILNYLLNNTKYKDNLLSLYLVNYSVGRFVLEFFRGDIYRGFLLGLSTSQWISIGILLAVIINSIYHKKNLTTSD